MHDALSRRRIRREYSWSYGAWNLTNEVRYVYNGYLPVQERDGNNFVQVSYTRGLDLSGGFHEAGGISGLLGRRDSSGSGFYHTDGGGNISALINSNQAAVAKYSYDPFGNIVAMSGSLAEANTYRFSSKELHKSSGTYHYGFRSYEPNLQRWLNQDPIGEAGGINLYAMVFNSPINRVDPFGWSDFNRPPARVISGPSGPSVRYGPPMPDPRITGHDEDFAKFLDKYHDWTDNNWNRLPQWFRDGYDVMDEAGWAGTPLAGMAKSKKICDIAKEVEKVRKAKDRLRQFEEITEAQRKVRKGQSDQQIDRIKKSKRRDKNLLKDIADDPSLADDLY